MHSLIAALLHRRAQVIPVTDRVLAGHLGHHHAWRTAQPGHVPRISTRRADAALSRPDDGPYAGMGPQRQAGRKLDARSLPEQ